MNYFDEEPQQEVTPDPEAVKTEEAVEEPVAEEEKTEEVKEEVQPEGGVE